jgi:hypothetical protein
MPPKLKFFVTFIMLITIGYPAMAEGSGEASNNQQSPLQTIVQITITAIVLIILRTFKLP